MNTDPAVEAELDELARLVPGARLVTDPGIVAGFLHDQVTALPAGSPRGVVMPRSTDDVVAVMAWATRHRVPVVPRGAGTGLAGGATAIDGSLIVCLSRMTTIREIDPQNRVAVAEAGVITADVDRAAREVGLMYAPDPSSVELSTIGGNVATNAGGLRCVKYGVTRDSVLGVEAVLADGRVLSTGGRTIKNVAGYDLTGLLVGSEGTLGIITSATLRLLPAPPRDPVTLVGGFPSLVAAASAVSAVVAAGLRPSLLELLDHATLRAIDDWKHLGLSGTEAMLIAQFDDADADTHAEQVTALFTAAGADDVAVSSDPRESAQLLEVRRLAYPAAERLGRCLVEDVGVPVSRLADMVARIEQAAERHGVQVVTVAHAGDGNLHPTFVFDSPDGAVPQSVWRAADDVFHAALELGGTLTGEHGVGLLKQRWLPDQLGPVGTAVNRAIKDALDPLGLLNPGRGI
ncbi:MAG: FAD-binding protein [Intrasporangium sp.]|uniref:FAD-binding oxidoreductase n=1 Tax=Intrasporangium sp. TaxID=1925024 RepID=UPI0026499796|nr:FAD-linked oxidase C-terminal domain-containing protein [Intrasporangium sp.]MDN5796591.1 FAD-binding protein [Intrasporangium sp.]